MKQPLERPMKQPLERPQEWPMKQPLRAAATLPGARLTALVRLAPLAVAQEFFHQRFRARWERRKHASDDETQAAKGAAQIVAQIPVTLSLSLSLLCLCLCLLSLSSLLCL